MTERKPSEIFLALLKDAADVQAMSFERFQLLIDTWSQIRELEAMATAKKYADKREKSTRAPAEKVRADGVEKVHEDPPADGVQNGPPSADAAEAKRLQGRASLAARKKNVIAGIEAVRSAGRSIADIAEAGTGLTISDVMTMIERKPLPLPKLAAMEKAIRKLQTESAAPEPGLPAAPLEGD
ncbi:MAG: hypothetical protein IKQ10_07605 [Oscillospiraceae bacterium]|nr:hypothetical protein [Oscillospiraceae bacterium]